MLGGLLLAPVLIVHILAEHLMYAWWVITCPCSNSAILAEHLMYAWWGYTCPCSSSAHIEHLVVNTCPSSNVETSDVCLVGYYLPLF